MYDLGTVLRIILYFPSHISPFKVQDLLANLVVTPRLVSTINFVVPPKEPQNEGGEVVSSKCKNILDMISQSTIWILKLQNMKKESENIFMNHQHKT